MGEKGFFFSKLRLYSSNSENILTKFINHFRNKRPISITLGKTHPKVKESQVCTNNGPHHVSKGGDRETLKIHH